MPFVDVVRVQSGQATAVNIIDGEESEFELEEGQEVVGVVVQAPKTGRGASDSLGNYGGVDMASL